MTEEPLRGFAIRRTPFSEVTVVEIDYYADPAKATDEWLAAARKQYPSQKKFQREFGRDWTSAEGDSFYPEFEFNGGRQLYVRKAPGLIDGPVIRGWDLGQRRPAVAWLQVSPSFRTWYLREFMPAGVSVHEMGYLVKWLSGEMDDQDLVNTRSKVVLHWASILRERRGKPWNRYPEPPWFPPGQLFWDYAGPEANYTTDMVASDSPERTRATALAGLGINLRIHTGPVKGRETVMRKLLSPRHDGLPGVLFDPAMDLMIDAMSGGLAYKKGSATDPSPDEPAKDGFYDNIHDAATYPIASMVPLDDPRGPQPEEMVWDNRRLVPLDPFGPSLGWYETRR